MYWIICLSALICLIFLFRYIRSVAYKIKTFDAVYKQELNEFQKHADRELFDWDEARKRRSGEVSSDVS
jgi:hypothetical protein